MKTNLTVKDRLVLGGILPQQGDIRTMTITEDIRKKTSLSQEEMEYIGFRVENNACKWEPEKSATRDIDFSEAECDVILERFKELDKDKAVTADILSLYKLFKQ